MNQIAAHIQMADIILEIVMDNDNLITWRSTDRFTGDTFARSVPEGKESLFWQAVHVALSGEDGVDNYSEIEELLDFVSYTKSTRWIP